MMRMKQMRSIKGLTIVSIILFILFLLVGPFIYFSYFYIPSSLLVDGYLYKSDLSKDQKIVVNYLKQDALDHKSEMKSMIDETINVLTDKEFEYRSVTMDVTPLNEHYLLVNLANVSNGLTQSYTYNTDTNTFEESLHFSHKFQTMVRSLFINKARNDQRYHDIAYTSAFIDILDASNYMDLIDFDGNDFTFTSDFGYGELSVSVDMRYYQDDVSIELANSLDQKTVKYRVPFNVNTNNKIIYFAVNHAFNRSLDYQWIEAFNHYGQSLSFIVNGAKINGNADLVITALNNGNSLISTNYNGLTLTELNTIQKDHELYGTIRLIEEITNYEYTNCNFYVNNNEDSLLIDPYFNQYNASVELYSLDQLTLDYFNQMDNYSLVVMDDGNHELMQQMIQLLPELMDNGYQLLALPN